MENEDKQAWCELGQTQEIDFVANRRFRGTAVKINPKKKVDKYSHDFRLNVGADLKTITTEWKHSERMFGIPHPYAISINEKDLCRYMDLYPNILFRKELGAPLEARCVRCKYSLIATTTQRLQFFVI